MRYDWMEGNRLEMLEGHVWEVLSEEERRLVEDRGMPSLPYYRGELLTVREVLMTMEVPTTSGDRRHLTEEEMQKVEAKSAI